MDLLEEWREVHREAVQLCEVIEQIPDECQCGDADGHLGGRCPCCGAHQNGGHIQGGGGDCSDLLASVRATVSLFYEDFRRVAPPAVESAPAELRLEVRRGVFLAASDIEELVAKLDQLGQAVVGFRRTCAVAQMKGIKRHGAALRTHCDRLDAELQQLG